MHVRQIFSLQMNLLVVPPNVSHRRQSLTQYIFWLSYKAYSLAIKNLNLNVSITQSHQVGSTVIRQLSTHYNKHRLHSIIRVKNISIAKIAFLESFPPYSSNYVSSFKRIFIPRLRPYVTGKLPSSNIRIHPHTDSVFYTCNFCFK